MSKRLLSTITIPSGATYDIKDAYARDSIDFLTKQIIFDGTAKSYNYFMKEWFKSQARSQKTITELCNDWYALTRRGWVGTTTFSQPDKSTASTGTKGGDNSGLVCIPSTETVANQDDYAGLPLFAVSTVNWELDSTGKKVITAIKGIHDNFEQDNPKKYVGVMQMTAYVWCTETDSTITYGYADSPDANKNAVALPESREVDDTINNFMLHTKYVSSTVDGKMTSCSGLIPTRNNSHNSVITLSGKNGTMYSAGTLPDISFLDWMSIIKYASITQDGINQGCINYNYQYYAVISENNVNRIIFTKSEGANFLVGSTILIGSYDGSSIDRGTAANYSISGINGRIIKSVETVTIDGTEYTAIYVSGSSFSTVANGKSTSGTTIVSTYHWATGTNDEVLGNDGSKATPGGGMYPAMIQGIEFAIGGYEVLSDTILKINDGNYELYIARKKAHQTTSINSNMINTGLKSPQPASSSWCYIKRKTWNGEVFFATDTTGATSSTFCKDAFYKVKSSTNTGSYEYLLFGSLTSGVARGGLSCVSGINALGHETWNYLARLSPNGNRGELTA